MVSSWVEKRFAEQLEKNEAVKVTKLIGWFMCQPRLAPTIQTGWSWMAERLYFVVETKASLFLDDLRDKEIATIKCVEEHFKALAVAESPADYIKARKIVDLMAHC